MISIAVKSIVEGEKTSSQRMSLQELNEVLTEVPNLFLAITPWPIAKSFTHKIKNIKEALQGFEKLLPDNRQTAISTEEEELYITVDYIIAQEGGLRDTTQGTTEFRKQCLNIYIKLRDIKKGPTREYLYTHQDLTTK